VEGIVQGVGFRPFVHGLAGRLDLAGFVGNDAQGVFIEIEGGDGAVADFLRILETEPPPLAVIERVTADAVPAVGEERFTIVPSRAGGESQALISPDTATCDECLAEIWDETGRRYRYPFTNCTNCGPRFTIVRGVPYDRPLTTMAPFEMCPRCAAEYHDPGDRRFHAQPVCCPDCGPRLLLTDGRRRPLPGDDPLGDAVALLAAGRILAVKGLGGYHLAVRADDEEAVARLRARKHREEKPFAVMVVDLAAASALCSLGPGEAALLAGSRRPIVLAPKRENLPLAPSVAPGNRALGLMLPYTPLHHLLARDLAVPFVLTSGNISDEPIASADDDAFERLDAIADGFLLHERAIHIRTDDSVVRSFRDRVFLVRRSRGFAPEPVLLPWAFPRPVLATGAELKSTFCVAKDRRAFVSHHIGDLENYETFASFRDGIDHFCNLFEVQPEVVAHDLHPEYLSTKHAHDLAGVEANGVELTGVQHHHAHIASCLADNGEEGPVIGVAFDGLGFGPDGTIWGGEILVADLAGFERVAHLAPVAMPGGAAAIKEPWRMAAAYLAAAFEGAVPGDLPLITRQQERWTGVVSLARAGVSAPLTSSAGRLFDAVAAVLGVRDIVSYEGQAAIELEQLADPDEREAYPLDIAPGGSAGGAWQLLGTGLVRAVVADQAKGTPAPLIAARFHNGLAAGVAGVCRRLRAERGLDTVALSGGVFQNLLLLERCVAALELDGFRVLLHGRVPPNDGGISLGQAAVAGALDRRRIG
jgi:hydrogenase maturation protein HypF